MAYSSSLSSPFCFHATNPTPHLNPKTTPRYTPFLTRPMTSSFAVAALPPLAFADVDAPTIAVIGGGSVAALVAVLSLTDPERRRKLQAEEVGGGDKEVVRVVQMLTDEGSLKGVSVCDAGCGTVCVSIPLAKEGAVVSASDISVAMVAEAEKQVSCSLLVLEMEVLGVVG